MRLTWRQVAWRRMSRQGLVAPLVAGPADVVSAMCGAQAQVASAAELSVALRLAAATRADVRRAVRDERSLVRTFGPRGTVHLVAAADLASWVGACAELPVAPSPFAPDVRLDPDRTEQVLAALDDALAPEDPGPGQGDAGGGAVALSVDELDAAVVARVGAWAGERVMPAFRGFWPRWRQVLAQAAGRGVLCFGPARGRTVTYVSPRRWLPGFDPDGARAAGGARALLGRYLHAYGPAAPGHFARWLNVPPVWAAALFDGSDLEPVTLDGVDLWQLPDETTAEHAVTGVRLLPYFDAYAIAAMPRELLFPGPAGTRALNRGQAGNRPVVLVDDVVAGVWHARTTGTSTRVVVETWTPLSGRRLDALAEQVDRIGAASGTRATFVTGPVTAGPHA